jgi:glycosyltransferase involved in cell wall biosynthesis
LRRRRIRGMKGKLTIVQVMSNSPNARRLPPTNQGGTEKIVYELTQSLVRRGHRVILFAPRGSRTNAKLIPFPKGMRDRGIARFVARRLPHGTDIVHDHTFRSAVGRRRLPVPVVCTMHMPVRNRVKHPVYVSKRARRVMGGGRGHSIYNGIKIGSYEFSERKSDYLLFMGRIIRAKGVLQAIQVAERTNRKLIIAGPVKDRAYFHNVLAPRIRRNPNIRYVGAVGGKRKQTLLKRASCLLFPSLWEEPFGLVMIEAMACGTPVLALRRGAVPEVMAGFPHLICGSVDEMAAKVRRRAFPAPGALRKYVMRRFTVAKMTNRYVRLYRGLIRKR